MGQQCNGHPGVALVEDDEGPVSYLGHWTGAGCESFLQT